jgi:hypothetical protein
MLIIAFVAWYLRRREGYARMQVELLPREKLKFWYWLKGPWDKLRTGLVGVMVRVSSITGRERFFEVSYISFFLNNFSPLFLVYILRSSVYLFSSIGMPLSSLIEYLIG